MTPQPMLSLNQLADHLALPASWLKREADAGRLPCLRVGRRRMFDPESVRRELARRAETYTPSTTEARS